MRKYALILLLAAVLTFAGCKATHTNLAKDSIESNADNSTTFSLASNANNVVNYLYSTDEEYHEVFKRYIKFGVEEILEGATQTERDELLVIVLDLCEAIENNKDLSQPLDQISSGLSREIEKLDQILSTIYTRIKTSKNL